MGKGSFDVCDITSDRLIVLNFIKDAGGNTFDNIDYFSDDDDPMFT